MSVLRRKKVLAPFITIMFVKEILAAGLGTRTCSVSRQTVQKAHHCPLNKEGWKERGSILKCSEVTQNCSSPSEFIYHCVRDSYGKLIEVCAPLTTLVGNTCPEFNHGGERIQEDYTDTGHCKECPFSYSSRELYKYSECLEISNDTSKTSYPNFRISYGNSTTTFKASNKTDEEETNRTSVIVSIIVPCIASVIFILFIVLVLICALRKHVHKEELKENEEEEALVDKTGPQVHQAEANNQENVQKENDSPSAVSEVDVYIKRETIEPKVKGFELMNGKDSAINQEKEGELEATTRKLEHHKLKENKQEKGENIEDNTLQPKAVLKENEKRSAFNQDKDGTLGAKMATEKQHKLQTNNHEKYNVMEMEILQPNERHELTNEKDTPVAKNTKDEDEKELTQPKEGFELMNETLSEIVQQKEDNEMQHVVINPGEVLKGTNEKLPPFAEVEKGGKDSTLSDVFYRRFFEMEMQIGRDAKKLERNSTSF